MNVEVNKSPTRSRTWSVLSACAPLLIVAAAAGGVVALKVWLPDRTREAPPTDPPPVNVTVQVIRTIPKLPDTLLLHGVVEPDRVVKVAAEVSGQIKKYGQRKSTVTREGRKFSAGATVAEGEPVTEGDPIVLLDADLLQAEHDRAKAQADYDRREYARTVELHEKNVASRTELDQTKTRMEVSKATLMVARERLDRAVIEAPISGILNRLPEEVGQFVQPGTCIAEIVDIRIAKVVVGAPEKDVHYLKVGDKAQVLIDSLGGREVEGEITFISELADDRARTTRVEISVENAGRLLRSGQIVRVRLTRQVLTDVVMIPLRAVIPREQDRVVYVVDGETASRRLVKLGFMKGIDVRVLEGLSAGDRLIVEGHRFVGPGQSVRVAGSAAPSGETPQPASIPTRPPDKR